MDALSVQKVQGLQDRPDRFFRLFKSPHHDISRVTLSTPQHNNHQLQNAISGAAPAATDQFGHGEFTGALRFSSNLILVAFFCSQSEISKFCLISNSQNFPTVIVALDVGVDSDTKLYNIT